MEGRNWSEGQGRETGRKGWSKEREREWNEENTRERTTLTEESKQAHFLESRVDMPGFWVFTNMDSLCMPCHPILYTYVYCRYCMYACMGRRKLFSKTERDKQ